MDYTFTFTEQEANLVVAALAKLPFEVSNTLIAKIQRTAQGQNPEPESAQDSNESSKKSK